jgi:hypothetical protein
MAAATSRVGVVRDVITARPLRRYNAVNNAGGRRRCQPSRCRPRTSCPSHPVRTRRRDKGAHPAADAARRGTRASLPPRAQQGPPPPVPWRLLKSAPRRLLACLAARRLSLGNQRCVAQLRRRVKPRERRRGGARPQRLVAFPRPHRPGTRPRGAGGWAWLPAAEKHACRTQC